MTTKEDVIKLAMLLVIPHLQNRVDTHDYNDDIVRLADIRKMEIAKEIYEG